MSLTKVTNSLLALGEDTSSLNLPKGTTAQRPSSPVAGMVRENTDDNVIEYYNGTEWKQVKSEAPAILVDYLVVAGGGGGGGLGGGGGAGGLRSTIDYTGGNGTLENNASLIQSTQYTITIGAGGAGGSSSVRQQGGDGGNSVFANITSIGGGGGAGFNQNTPSSDFDGGSGGGGANASGTGNYIDGGDGTLNQGFDGGRGYRTNLSYNAMGGGGGALSLGTDGSGVNTSPIAGVGGSAASISITGTIIDYATGGKGFQETDPAVFGPSGVANLGNGAGGGSGLNSYANAGNGSSGVVILRLLTSQYSGTTTGSPTVTTDGSHTVLTYTSSGTYTA